MGLKWSHHKNRGWRSQLDRVRRWYRRVQRIGRANATIDDLEEEHDDVYAFFQNCYYLREWIDRSNFVEKKDLDELMANNRELQLCRDICNGTKHLEISRPSVDADFSIGREYVDADEPGDRPHINETWFLIAGGEKRDVFELADCCMELWDTFIEAHDLEHGDVEAEP